MLSDHKEMNLEINMRSKFGKFTYMWKLKNKLLNNEVNKEYLTKETRKHFKKIFLKVNC